MKLLFTAAQYEPLRNMPQIRDIDIEIVATPFLTDDEFREFLTLLTTGIIHDPEQALNLIRKKVISIAPSFSASEPEAVAADTRSPEILPKGEETPEQALDFDSLINLDCMLPYDSHAVDTYAPTLHQPPAQARPPVVMEMDFPFLEENFRLFPSAEPTPQRTESITLKTSKINLKHIFVMLTMIKDILSEWHENAERLPQFLNIIDTNYLGILPKSFVMAWQQKPYQNKKPFEIVQHLCLIMLHLLASYETHNENEQKRIKKLIDGLSIINGIASSKAKYRLQRDTIKAFANQFGEWAFEEIMNSPHQQMFGISLFLYPKSLLQPTPASSHAKTIICLVKILRTVFNIPYDSKINEKREASEELPAAASSIRKRAHLPQPGSESNEEIVLNALPRPI